MIALFHSIVLLNVLLICGAWSIARPSAVIAGILAWLSVVWVFYNQPLEGRVLWEFSPHRGLTESDLLAVAGMVASLGALLRSRRSRDRRT